MWGFVLPGLTGLTIAWPAVPVTRAQSAVISPGAANAQSFNWAGYVATGGSYTGIGGTWTIPSVPTATSLEADAAWVGIGGVQGQDLIQAGTQDIVNPGGAVTYQAFYEILPATSVIVPLAMHAGDSVTAAITETAASEWAISLRNNTTGQTYATSVNYQSSLSSADWIQEMPSAPSGFVPLDSFGSVSFASAYAVVNGAQTNLSGTGAQALTMTNRAGAVLADVTSTGSDGASFTVTRESGTPSASSGYGSNLGYGQGGRWRRVGVGIQGYVPGTRGARSTSTRAAGGAGDGFGFRGFGNFRTLFNELGARYGVLFRNGRVLFSR